MRKGIILAGGTGSRLFPVTEVISKQLLPVYDKPLIYYPLSTLMLANIRDILIITTPSQRPLFEALLGDGSQWGIKLSYQEQVTPDGLAQAFILAEEFLQGAPVCLILGDNVFFGSGLSPKLAKATASSGATIFGYQVKDPERFGVIEFDHDKKVCALSEKPVKPLSNYIATGLYFFDHDVVAMAKQLQPSARGELEITDLINAYIKTKPLALEMLGRGFAWLDTGTHESLLEAAQFVETVEKRQGFKIACLEEIAFKKHWITAENVTALAKRYEKSGYGSYLYSLLEDKI
jgi:glucose-1-phosphate thymidylyltransferase